MDKKEKDSSINKRKEQAEFPTLSRDEPVEDIGTQIGSYKLLSILGEGGMGLVYLAEQKEPIKRRVALKIIKPGMDSKQVIGRFEQERQALALLDHPNIAHIYDGGTTELGHPYFVMEYVKGSPITKYCDKKELNIEKRLELFEQVCEAVQHAHQKGIIHRDIKPSNILVQDKDDKPIPMIIDFGIAKATQPLTERTIFTKLNEPMGTLEYMSPEQADMTIHGIDTRSDIYSLGVVLYELLTGTLPFTREELEKAGRAEMQRVIRETEPPRPSARLSSLGDEAKKIAERRHTEVIALTKRLHRELEWIPLMAMRKEADRRYKTASELADDVKNYLNGDPLIAGPESITYRAGKFIKKRRGLVAAVVAVVATLLIGMIATTDMYLRAEKAKRETQKQLYFSYIGQADDELRNNRIEGAREFLDLCPEDLRHWEWNHLNWLISLRDRHFATLPGHEHIIASLAFSHDGRYVASGSEDSTVKVWNVQGKSEVKTLRGAWSGVTSVAFSPDGKYIAAGSGNYHMNIMVWDFEKEKMIKESNACDRAGKYGVYSVAFSPDGRYIAAGTSYHSIRVWDANKFFSLENGKEAEAEIFSLDNVYGMAFSPDSKLIAACTEDAMVKMWDIEEGSEIKELRGHKSLASSLSFSIDGKLLASGSVDGAILVWDLEREQAIKTFAHGNAVSYVDFREDGRHIASMSIDGVIKIWPLYGVEEILILEGSSRTQAYSGCLSFSPDGKILVSNAGPEENSLKLWDTAQIPPQFTMRGGVYEDGAFYDDEKRTLNSIASLGGGNLIVSGHGDGLVKIWNTQNGQEIMNLGGYTGQITDVAARRNIVASGGTEGIVQVWELECKGNTQSYESSFLGSLRVIPSSGITAVDISPDTSRVVAGAEDGRIEVWCLYENVKPLELEGHQGAVHSVSFDPTGERILSGGVDKTLRIWDAGSGAEIFSQDYDTEVRNVMVSSNGRYIAVSGDSGEVSILDGGDWHHLSTLKTLQDSAVHMAFSSDGNRIITGVNSSAVIWDSASGQKILELASHREPIRGELGLYGTLYFYPKINSIAFSSDSKTVVAGLNNGHIKIWPSAISKGGYKVWHEVDMARRLVDELCSGDSYYHFDERLGNSPNFTELSPDVLNIVKRIARARRGNPSRVLRRAVWANDQVMVSRLLAEGADIDGGHGWRLMNPLQIAASQGSREMVRFLISNGADVDRKLDDQTAIHFAELNGHEEIAAILRGQSKAASEISNAVKQGNIAEVKAILKQKPELLNGACDREGRSLLHQAALSGDIGTVQFLITEGADIESEKNRDWSTPLFEAIRGGHEEVVSFLLKQGANVNAKRVADNTPLHLAVELQHSKIVKLLIEGKANVDLRNSPSDGSESALSIAIEKGDTGIVRLLLEAGADVNTTDHNGYASLHFASMEGQLEIAEMLIAQGANVNARANEDSSSSGWAPIHFASRNGNKDLVQLLIDKGADVNSRAFDDLTALHIAANRGHKSLLQLLLDRGAEVNAKTKPREHVGTSYPEGTTPLDLATMDSIAQLLISRGAKINRKDKWEPEIIVSVRTGDIEAVEAALADKPELTKAIDVLLGRTPLHWASSRGNATMVELLVANAAELNAKDQKGLTPLHLAAEAGSSEVVDKLIGNSVEIEPRDNNGCTPLHLAAMRGHIEIVRTLADKGAQVNCGNIAGATPLYYAVLGGQAEVATLLRERGGHLGKEIFNAAEQGDIESMRTQLSQYPTLINEKDPRWKWTPLIWAIRGGHNQIVRLLVSKGAKVNGRHINDWTPLHYAARYGHADIADFLIDRGARVNAKNKVEYTPLYYATVYNHKEVEMVLRAHGGNLGVDIIDAADQGNSARMKALLSENRYWNYIKDPIRKWNPLFWAVHNGHYDTVEILLRNNRDAVRGTDVWDRRPLHWAARQGHQKLVELLISKGALINARTKSGITPMYYAAVYDHISTAEFLRSRGGSLGTEVCDFAWQNDSEQMKSLIATNAEVVNSTDSEYELTPLHWAVLQGHKEMTKFLIINGADPNAKDKWGNTSLHYAAYRGQKEIVEFLISKGADTSAKNNKGHTALTSALDQGHKEMVELLQKHGDLK